MATTIAAITGTNKYVVSSLSSFIKLPDISQRPHDLLLSFLQDLLSSNPPSGPTKCIIRGFEDEKDEKLSTRMYTVSQKRCHPNYGRNFVNS